ncbi:hypothetical protein PsorP6_017811 [Peronosclerospora sorghi]|uniref:Uncharacterized protein n=1 Tax=Peronosclerospora sorghi TaxID=230839 RepID=A0ACC0WCV7_9STRA|nr:hypothetical protein PsorP6_017811 [Peronosclerospora sorghi]
MAQKVLATPPDALVDVVDDVIECLVAFGVCGADDVARGRPETFELTHSVELLRQVLMDQLMHGDGNKGLEAGDMDDQAPVKARRMHLMWHVVTALTTLAVEAVDRRLDVQVAALDALFDGLTTHGRTLSSRAWHRLFKTVLLPLVDEVQALERTLPRGRVFQLPRGTRPEGTGSTPATVCRARVVPCFGHVYERVGYLPDVLSLVGKCLDAVDDESDESVATSTASAVEMLVTHGHKFSRSVGPDCR